ncbi:MAG: capsule assembly Wzi family protein [Planctomycetota bacterium]
MSNRPFQFRYAAVLAPLLFLLFISPAKAQSSANVSLDHRSYRFLEHLDTLGLVDSRIGAVKPFTRLEVSRLLVEADDLSQVRLDNRSDLLLAKIKNFQREFRAETNRLLQADSGEGETFFKPLQSVYARYDYLDKAETPQGDFGRVLNRGSQAITGLTLHGTLFDFLSFHSRVEERFHFHNWVGRDEDKYKLEWLETYAKLAYWNIEIEGGLDSLSWGHGVHDNLVLSHNAEPFPMIKITNPMPTLLPWIFSALGPIKTQFFFTRLDRRRAVREPYLAGMKVNFRPLPFLEFGMTRTAVFGGKDRPSIDWWGIIRGTEDNPKPGQTDLSNQLAGFDLRLRIPLPIGGLAAYAEAYGEDEAGNFPYKWSYLFGVHLAGILPQRNLWIRAEWAQTHETAYVHGTYSTGYNYRLEYPGHTMANSSLGHHIGNNSEDFYVELGLYPFPCTEIVLFGDWEERLPRGKAFEEEHIQFGGSVSHRFDILGGLTVTGEFRWRTIRNYGFVWKKKEQDSYVQVKVELQF